METEFNIRAEKKRLHSGEDELSVFLFEMTRKSEKLVRPEMS